MRFRSDIPLASRRWIWHLCDQLDVKHEWWTFGRREWTRTERLAMTLIVAKLQKAHGLSLLEAGQMLGKSRTALHPYKQRADLIFDMQPHLERMFTKIEGEQSVEFLLHSWPELWSYLLDPDADSRVLA